MDRRLLHSIYHIIPCTHIVHCNTHIVPLIKIKIGNEKLIKTGIVYSNGHVLLWFCWREHRFTLTEAKANGDWSFALIVFMNIKNMYFWRTSLPFALVWHGAIKSWLKTMRLIKIFNLLQWFDYHTNFSPSLFFFCSMTKKWEKWKKIFISLFRLLSTGRRFFSWAQLIRKTII